MRNITIAIASGKGVAERWSRQYGDDWRSVVGIDGRESSKEIYELLCGLGSDPDMDKVDRIIGNKSWTRVTCASCGDAVDRAAEFGYDTVKVCADCMRAALRAMGKRQ